MTINSIELTKIFKTNHSGFREGLQKLIDQRRTFKKRISVLSPSLQRKINDYCGVVDQYSQFADLESFPIEYLPQLQKIAPGYAEFLTLSISDKQEFAQLFWERHDSIDVKITDLKRLQQALKDLNLSPKEVKSQIHGTMDHGYTIRYNKTDRLLPYSVIKSFHGKDFTRDVSIIHQSYFLAAFFTWEIPVIANGKFQDLSPKQIQMVLNNTEACQLLRQVKELPDTIKNALILE